MSNNTALNPRILLADLAVEKLTETFRTRLPIKYKIPLNQMRDKVKGMKSYVQEIKYSYITDEELVKHEKVLALKTEAEKIYDAVKNGYRIESAQYTVAEAMIYWACNILKRLPERLAEDKTGRKIEAGVDSIVVGIRSVQPIEDTNLYFVRVYDGKNTHKVVTNISDVKTGEKMAICFLPPAEIGGHVSEAMFLGEDRYPDAEMGESVYRADFTQVRGILKQEFGKILKVKK